MKHCIQVPHTFKMDVTVYYGNGYPEFGLVMHGSATDEEVIWTGDVTIPELVERKGATKASEREREAEL